jgi:hypothetical protein
VGFFNPLANANDSSACEACPLAATTLAPRSISSASCVCEPDYFDDRVDGPAGLLTTLGADTHTHTHTHTNGTFIGGSTSGSGSAANRTGDGMVTCRHCTSGTDCANRYGITLRTLPVSRGFWRPSPTSRDVRRCPDAGVGCERSGRATCNESLSGCRGGDDATALCTPDSGLFGPFCLLCERGASSTRRYYRPASSYSHTAAKCGHCADDGVIVRFFVTYAAIGAAIGAVVAAACYSRRYMKDRDAPMVHARMQLAARFWHVASVPNKLKILLGFFQIVVVVEKVYELTLPSDVRQVLSTISFLVSFGLTGIDDVLSCMGLHGFVRYATGRSNSGARPDAVRPTIELGSSLVARADAALLTSRARTAARAAACASGCSRPSWWSASSLRSSLRSYFGSGTIPLQTARMRSAGPRSPSGWSPRRPASTKARSPSGCCSLHCPSWCASSFSLYARSGSNPGGAA